MQEYDTNKVSLDITILALSSLSEPKWNGKCTLQLRSLHPYIRANWINSIEFCFWVYSIWTSALW